MFTGATGWAFFATSPLCRKKDVFCHVSDLLDGEGSVQEAFLRGGSEDTGSPSL